MGCGFAVQSFAQGGDPSAMSLREIYDRAKTVASEFRQLEQLIKKRQEILENEIAQLEERIIKKKVEFDSVLKKYIKLLSKKNSNVTALSKKESEASSLKCEIEDLSLQLRSIPNATGTKFGGIQLTPDHASERKNLSRKIKELRQNRKNILIEMFHLKNELRYLQPDLTIAARDKWAIPDEYESDEKHLRFNRYQLDQLNSVSESVLTSNDAFNFLEHGITVKSDGGIVLNGTRQNALDAVSVVKEKIERLKNLTELTDCDRMVSGLI